MSAMHLLSNKIHISEYYLFLISGKSSFLSIKIHQWAYSQESSSAQKRSLMFVQRYMQMSSVEKDVIKNYTGKWNINLLMSVEGLLCNWKNIKERKQLFLQGCHTTCTNPLMPTFKISQGIWLFSSCCTRITCKTTVTLGIFRMKPQAVEPGLDILAKVCSGLVHFDGTILSNRTVKDSGWPMQCLNQSSDARCAVFLLQPELYEAAQGKPLIFLPRTSHSPCCCQPSQPSTASCEAMCNLSAVQGHFSGYLSCQKQSLRWPCLC